ncbi:biopolymer transporter ExbD [Pelagicoccus sp. SDUM812003]|uniref:ExbD/TolR family protein n=1 Tax=Pelagicoccus sp. SDUM812003 TaxID=3041267 RepID=UPI00280EC6A4|nr:biopolymer transporter ExbD [Pelagicoccus sp. SDUM812003]MDQ8205405.1 biopolymer transporter ExbD [Pelagicoccus sp. SDUM812003]
MMKNKKALSAGEAVGDINISPLIDMVFILLIFFIVTTVFVKEPGVEITRPAAVNTVNLPKNVILIAVTDQDNIFYGGRDYGLGGIRSQVRRVLAGNEDYPVIIQADQNARSGTVIRLIDECKLAQARRIHLSTVKN